MRNTGEIIAATEVHWRIPSSPIVEAKQRKIHSGLTDSSWKEEGGEGGRKEEEDEQRLKSNNPNLKGGELLKNAKTTKATQTIKTTKTTTNY